jgi:hypothetical protein
LPFLEIFLSVCSSAQKYRNLRLYFTQNEVEVEKVKKQLPYNEFSSETASRISQSKLHKIINELIDEYV